MSRASVLIIIGALAVVVPFSGLPVDVRTMIAVGLGAAVIGIGVAERSREQHRLVALQSSTAAPDSLHEEPVSSEPLGVPEPAPPEIYMPDPVVAQVPAAQSESTYEPVHEPMLVPLEPKQGGLIPDMQPAPLADLEHHAQVPMPDIEPAAPESAPAHHKRARSAAKRGAGVRRTTRSTRPTSPKATQGHGKTATTA